ncbi:MAG: hypothetical protein JRE64_06775, partial [Deltaproteobacteria bacterium]|nr:hypothetical protein [Deltaproteobacteria bacterium]
MSSLKRYKVLHGPEYRGRTPEQIISERVHFIIWDHKVLIRHWGTVSGYLHWAGEPAETVESTGWIDKGIEAVEKAANHIWEKNERGFTGIMMPQNMQPEIRDCWDRFRAGEVDLDSVKRIAKI